MFPVPHCAHLWTVFARSCLMHSCFLRYSQYSSEPVEAAQRISISVSYIYGPSFPHIITQLREARGKGWGGGLDVAAGLIWQRWWPVVSARRSVLEQYFVVFKSIIEFAGASDDRKWRWSTAQNHFTSASACLPAVASLTLTVISQITAAAAAERLRLQWHRNIDVASSRGLLRCRCALQCVVHFNTQHCFKL